MYILLHAENFNKILLKHWADLWNVWFELVWRLKDQQNFWNFNGINVLERVGLFNKQIFTKWNVT